jgi:diadenosine tetraphosphate (Ap4A) HIT family hydrolase
MERCLACDLTAGRVPLPGGRIHERASWVVEHCVGPLGVGTLVVKPKRHVLHVWELDAAEAAELGPLLRDVTGAVGELLEADQVYVCLWSHADGRPVHIHWIVQPIQAGGADGLHGPHLQAALFDRGRLPESTGVEAVAKRLRTRLTATAAS